MSRPEKSDNICMWCGEKTAKGRYAKLYKTKASSFEHVIPENAGGIFKLYKNDVCVECNNDLGRRIDVNFKKGHPLLSHLYQQDPSFPGKSKKTKDNSRIERRNKEKKKITTLVFEITTDPTMEKKITKISSNEMRQFTMEGQSLYEYVSDDFNRALHKVFANVVCYCRGSLYTREHCKELLEFVQTGRNPKNWAYLVSYRDPTINAFLNGELLFLFPADTNENIFLIVVIHGSGIWIGGSKPRLLQPVRAEEIEQVILKELKQKVKISIPGKTQEDIFNGYQQFLKKALKRKLMGDLNFLFVKKPISGAPHHTNWYLLRKCRTCGQFQPNHGMIADRKSIVQEYVAFIENQKKSGVKELDGGYHYNANTWNRYHIEDFEHMNINLSKKSNQETEEFISKYGINVMKKFPSNNNRFIETCINCGAEEEFSDSDLVL